MSTPNAEDLVVEFNDLSNDKYRLDYQESVKLWIIWSENPFPDEWKNIVARFTLLRDAEACAEILKMSV
jgi:hypothetical protein